MRAGRLDRLIDIQRKTETQSASGEPQATWANIASRKPASYRPMSGDERFSNPQLVANEQVEFRIRYSDTLSSLSPLDRIIYPALNSGVTDIPDRRVYDVLAVHEIGRREGLQIVTRRRADVSVT